ncbi:MAG: type II secretion system secretin GspD [Methylovulum sp.]|uniref:type II secretion system secretin GspD n=1 Tax=Methylovulum sp. TaxID=1916980 RepID=UPI002626E27B|nr:type II secretion system secretin GspD [Methylovulum sp.]MDD2722737.1 type II secretion system secretin GspD [Methylovulum sp.]MDD5123965.1 type II secretion system secretin GspD [Methylovulum sp.]
MPFRLLIALLFILTCSFAKAEKDEFTLNLNEVDMRVMIDTVADITGKNFIVDPHVAGKVTVVTAKPMRASQIYEIFLSILKVHGFAAVADGNIVKIVQNVNAKQELNQPSKIAGADDLLTKVIQVHHVDAVQLEQILLPLMPQHAFMSAFPDSNVIILSDTAGNVNRLAQMIEQIDRQGNLKIDVIKLDQADAADAVKTLTTLISSKNAGKTSAFLPALVADERTNSVLISGDPASRAQVRALLDDLDHPVADTGDTEVIYLHYALAKDLVETLTGAKQKSTGDINAAKTESSTQKDFDVRADEATNALVITADTEKMRSLKAVIQQLDIRRAQVHIEAIIAEINYNKDQRIGVDWNTGKQNGVVGNVNTSGNTTTTLSDFITNAGKGLSVGYFVGGELNALLSAFAEDNNVNILSTPSLVTLDNEEANILVGQNIGIKTGSFTTNTSGSSNPFTTLQRQDVGIKLIVTPQINEGNAIKLKVKQEVSSVDTTTANSDNGVTINKREIDTSVLVDDSKILILGGLMQDDVEDTITKVPLLGDIPYLGRLFQYNNTAVKKKNLMVFIRTKILRDQDTALQLSSGKYNDIRIREQQVGKNGVFLMPQEHGPVLPKLAPNQVRPYIAPSFRK